MQIKTNKHFLKVVQGYALSLTSIISILPMNKKRDYNLSILILTEFLYIQKALSLATGGSNPIYRLICPDFSLYILGNGAQIVG